LAARKIDGDRNTALSFLYKEPRASLCKYRTIANWLGKSQTVFERIIESVKGSYFR